MSLLKDTCVMVLSIIMDKLVEYLYYKIQDVLCVSERGTQCVLLVITMVVRLSMDIMMTNGDHATPGLRDKARLKVAVAHHVDIGGYQHLWQSGKEGQACDDNAQCKRTNDGS